MRGATAVCRRWHAISCDDSLWRFFFHSRYRAPPLFTLSFDSFSFMPFCL